VVLLDEGTYTIEPDGRYVQRVRQVHQVLDAAAVRSVAERGFTWVRSHQTLTLDHVRVLKPTGEVVSEKAAQEQESDLPAPMNNPVYQELRNKRISLAGVAAGTITDVSWTVTETAPSRPGDFLFQWNFTGPMPVVSSRLIVSVPESFTPRFDERNLTFRKTETFANGRHVRTWATSNVAPHRPAQFEPDSNGVTMSVLVGTPASWTDIAKWYDGLARSRYALPADVASRVDSVVRASRARTQLDTIRALHRWTAQDIRYVSVALGTGGYQPRAPNEVLSTGFGDCKDKATLFIAALRRYRIAADPVLLSQSGRANGRMPSISQFDHAIAVVGSGAARTYTDLTAAMIPFGELPESYQGSFAVVVRPDGSSEQVRIPATPTDSNVSVVRMTLVMDTMGMLRGRVEQEVSGAPSYSLRNVFMQPDTTNRATMVRQLAQSMFPGANATADSFVAFDGRDLQAAPRTSFTVSAQGALRAVGDKRILTLTPFMRGNAAGFANRARTLAAAPARTTPIDASKILGMLVTTTDVRITLPAGWKAELPTNVLVTSFFGSYESRWTQQGDEVRLVRRIQGMRGIHPPQRIAEVIAFFEAVGADNYDFLTLVPASSN
jgi:hypothetical protein